MPILKVLLYFSTCILDILDSDGLLQLRGVTPEDLAKAALSQHFAEVIIKAVADFGHIFVHCGIFVYQY